MRKKILKVCFSHSLQDIDRVRDVNFERPRYIFAEELLPKKGNGKQIVDVGGGACEFLQIASRYGYMGVLVDGNAHNIEMAKSLSYDAIHCDLSGKINCSDNTFDGATLLDVIEHIPNAEKLMSETYRILKPGGFGILSTPNIASPGSRLSALLGKEPRHEGYHFRFFNKYTLDKLITTGRIFNRKEEPNNLSIHYESNTEVFPNQP